MGAWSASPQWACWSGLPAPLPSRSAASYGCEVWGTCQFPKQLDDRRDQRKELVQGYLAILREIAGVRTSTAFSILLAELGLKSIQDEWLLKAAKFWNSLAARSPHDIYKRMALDSCASAVARNRRIWARSMFRAIRDTEYDLTVRVDDVGIVDITALRALLTQRRDAVWQNLDICPKTCPTTGACRCTYFAWFARPPGRHARSLLDLPVS